jgi:uncharacterized membrane protein YebE (DUF533 family)
VDAIKLLGSLMGNKSLSSGLGSQLLGGLLGGGQQRQQQSASSGLAGILGGMLGGGGAAQPQQSAGGGLLGSVLGSVLGGGQQSAGGAGGLAGLVGGLLGGGDAQAAEQARTQIPAEQHQAANDEAVLMIRAMVNAAKSDGRVDQSEQENIVSKLGADVSQAEIDFLKQEFAAPLDVEGFARQVPQGMEQQIYALSLTSIDLDTQNEAQYLGQLAQNLKMDPALCNQIHDHLGAPKIFG